jgi:carbon starvation protein
MHATPILIIILCVLAIAYRYYSAFLAAKVACLDDARVTPGVRLDDGSNYHPISKWVLFGHHFAAISGAGPLVGPVLAAQFGYLPGLLWVVIGVCLGGAVQDFLVLAASVRRNGKSLAQIARDEISPTAGNAAMAAILFIIVIALAGLGKVVVQALGGSNNPLPANTVVICPAGQMPTQSDGAWILPAGSQLVYNKDKPGQWSETIATAMPLLSKSKPVVGTDGSFAVAAGSSQIIAGSSWGVFTIAATIPIALFVGLYMYRIRKGRTIEASLIGAALTIAATVAGGWIANSPLRGWFNLTTTQVAWSIAIYGFAASVLPVWLLLCPRDYLSSFLKIGTIALLVVGTILANPVLKAPAINHAFLSGGPTVNGPIFPFLFITIMCGAISGFHALVSSGTTPKMLTRESDARAIGYGAMLIEGLVGVVAMIAAASLAPADYYAMNTDRAAVPQWHEKLVTMGATVDHLNVYDEQTQESLRGRTGGAVTLAVGMAYIFSQASTHIAWAGESLWKYWYHFAIMFEALFILTTIDAGTRVGRFLLQELAGRVHPKLGRQDWLPGSILSSAIIVVGWSFFLGSGNFAAIWSMFGVANQMLAVIALAVVSAVMVAQGQRRYLWVTVLPMIVVGTTTTTAALDLFARYWTTFNTQWANPPGVRDVKVFTAAILSGSLIAAMLLCTAIILLSALLKCVPVIVRGDDTSIEAAAA